MSIAYPTLSAEGHNAGVRALADSQRVFVSQQHPEGRISFIHWETGAIESVTGFELNGRIVQ